MDKKLKPLKDIEFDPSVIEEFVKEYALSFLEDHEAEFTLAGMKHRYWAHYDTLEDEVLVQLEHRTGKHIQRVRTVGYDVMQLQDLFSNKPNKLKNFLKAELKSLILDRSMKTKQEYKRALPDQAKLDQISDEDSDS